MKKLLSVTLLIISFFIKTYGQIPAPYCVPTQGGGNCITEVTIGGTGLNNISGGCINTSTNYSFYTTPTATLTLGVGYFITVKCAATSIVSIWIDFDQDGIFAGNEWAQPYTASTTGIAFINIPTNAITGKTYMRVRSRNQGEINGFGDACTNFASGETEDYEITLVSPYTRDLSVSKIISPVTGCGLTSNTFITAKVFNPGVDTVHSCTITFDVNNGFSTGTNTINTPILPGKFYTHTFSMPANFSTIGNNTTMVYCSFVGDQFYNNDTAYATIINHPQITSFPFIEPFATTTLASPARKTNSTNSNSAISSAAKKTGLYGFVMSGSKTSISTFITPTLGTEWVLNQGFSSKLEYCIDAISLPSTCGFFLKFDLRQTAVTNVLDCSFRVLVNGTQISPTYHPQKAAVNNTFSTEVLDLSSFIGTDFNLTFESRNAADISLNAPGDNAFIDNIFIGPNPNRDMSTNSILAPITECGHSISDTIKVLFVNNSCDTLKVNSKVPVNYTFDGGATVSDTIKLIKNLLLGDSIYFSFKTPINDTLIGLHTIKVFCSLQLDADSTNDAIVYSYLTIPTIKNYPYNEGFENSPLYWLSKPVSGLTNWSIVTNPTTILSSLNANNGTNLAALLNPAGAGSSSEIVSPCLDFTTLNNPLLEFYVGIFQSASLNTWLKTYISKNAGATYVLLDSVPVRNPIAITPMWQKNQLCLDKYAHEPNVKIKFVANIGGSSDVGIDDITIKNAIDTNRVIVNDDTICAGSSITVDITSTNPLKNYFIYNATTNQVLSPVNKGTGANLSFTLNNLISSFVLKVGFTDSLPNSFCSLFLVDTASITVYQYTVANAGRDTSICFNASITLNVTGGQTYSWSPSAGLNQVNIANPVASPITTTTYYILADNMGHCSSQDTIIVSVNPLPIANAGLDLVACNPSTKVTIGALPSASSGTPPYTYLWNNSSSLNANNIANPVANPLTNTSYILTLTDKNLCSDIDTVFVKVNSQIITQTSSTNITCNGGSDGTASITVISGGIMPYSYSWGTSPVQTTTTINGLLANKYFVQIFDSVGCMVLDSVTITQPQPISSNLSSINTTCGQCNGIVAATVSGGTSPYSYLWSNSSNNDSLISICNGQYVLAITDKNGCKAKDSITVSGPGGSTSFTIDAGKNIEVCQGVAATIGGSPTLSGGLTPYIYSWSPNTNLSAINVSNPVATPISTTTYIVIATDNNGCTKSDSITVIVNPLPIANAGSNITKCKIVTATIGWSGVAGVAYSWSPTAGLNNPNIANPTVSITATQTYTVKATTAKGCIATDQISVTVNPEPLINAGSDVIIGKGGGASLSASGGAFYSWSPSTGLSTISGPLVIASPSTTTTYTVTATDNNGCTSTDDVIVYVVASGVDELSKKINLNVFPNPAGESTTITYQLLKSDVIQIQLFDALGKLIEKIIDENQSEGAHQLNIPTNHLMAGQYILVIKTEGGITYKRLIKK